eukprot:PhM_4_TR7209/c0_g1_i1/m.103068
MTIRVADKTHRKTLVQHAPRGEARRQRRHPHQRIVQRRPLHRVALLSLFLCRRDAVRAHELEQPRELQRVRHEHKRQRRRYTVRVVLEAAQPRREESHIGRAEVLVRGHGGERRGDARVVGPDPRRQRRVDGVADLAEEFLHMLFTRHELRNVHTGTDAAHCLEQLAAVADLVQRARFDQTTHHCDAVLQLRNNSLGDTAHRRVDARDDVHLLEHVAIHDGADAAHTVARDKGAQWLTVDVLCLVCALRARGLDHDTDLVRAHLAYLRHHRKDLALGLHGEVQRDAMERLRDSVEVRLHGVECVRQRHTARDGDPQLRQEHRQGTEVQVLDAHDTEVLHVRRDPGEVHLEGDEPRRVGAAGLSARERHGEVRAMHLVVQTVDGALDALKALRGEADPTVDDTQRDGLGLVLDTSALHRRGVRECPRE